MKFQAAAVCALVLLFVGAVPAEAQLLDKIVAANASYSTLVQLLTVTNLTLAVADALSSGTKLTIFAPDNAAFGMLSPATVTCLTNTTGGKALLATILKYHVAPGVFPPFPDNGMLTTLANITLTVNTTVGIVVGGVNVTAPNAITDDQGRVHGLGAVIIPPGGADLLATTCGASAPSPMPAAVSPPMGGNMTYPPPIKAAPPTMAPPPPPGSASSLSVQSSVLFAMLAGTFLLV